MRSLLLLSAAFILIEAFNIDIYAPIIKIGPNGTHFGFSIAEHFRGSEPVVLVGAPQAESGQVGTTAAGALFACPLNTDYSQGSGDWCTKLKPEYSNPSYYDVTPDKAKALPQDFHFLGKNGQLLGASVASQGVKNGEAVVCAPLVRFHNESAYTQGVCYQLESSLKSKVAISVCMQKNLERQQRHNDFGACTEGLSVTMKDRITVTGVVGARKWTGGVMARWDPEPGNLFANSVEKYTMRLEENSIRSVLTSHNYLGYSVGVGKFGFWHEQQNAVTVVSGATRYGEHGAVMFLPFNTTEASNSQPALLMTEDRFLINGTKMGSAFGYSLAVIDLNNDGFDDLIIGSPFEHRADGDGHFGGVVYVYFSKGKQRAKGESDQVFHNPVVLHGAGYFSQFGMSIANLGNIDGDPDGFNDFAIGAPFANDGVGAVYVFLGAKDHRKLRKKPAQVILGSDLPKVNNRPIRSFGFSLSGGVDLDDNGYPDLAVGAALSDYLAILRTRPVVSITTKHSTSTKSIEIERGKNCPHGSKTCLDLTLQIGLKGQRSSQFVDFRTNVLVCNLELLPFSEPPRALVEESRQQNLTWLCGKGVHLRDQKYNHRIYIPNDRHSYDWITPLKFKFSVKMQDERKPELPRESSGNIVDLNDYPVLNKYGASYEFTIPFNTRCGEDAICLTDLDLSAEFASAAKTGDGYVMTVGDNDYLDITFKVQNKREKAYQAAMFLNYDPEELELPEIIGKSVSMESTEKNLITVHLGNPMDQGATLNFAIRFKLVRGRTEGLGRPLRFNATVNSTSEEDILDNNKWESEVKIIKPAELELNGISTPDLVRFGGKSLSDSDIEYEEDIGPMLRHNYTVLNKGPWTVRNVTVVFDWPYKVASNTKGPRWALYLLDVPTITTLNTDGTTEVRSCHVEQRTEYVNPNQNIKLNTKYTTLLTSEIKREYRVKREVTEIATAAVSKYRIQPKPRQENGIDVNVVTINCQEGTAECFQVRCHFDFLDANSAPIIDFRARLWNSTFIMDYYDVEYVEVASSGRIEIDPNQGIKDDPSNNEISVKTLAYPDRPNIDQSVPWYVYALAAAIGFFILFLIVLLLYKCGFFKRKRPNQPSLYTAELRHEQEQWG